jgi:hypothetical protein
MRGYHMKMSIKNFLAVMTLMAVVGGSTVSGMIQSSTGGDKQNPNENNDKKRKLDEIVKNYSNAEKQEKQQQKKLNKRRKKEEEKKQKVALFEIAGIPASNEQIFNVVHPIESAPITQEKIFSDAGVFVKDRIFENEEMQSIVEAVKEQPVESNIPVSFVPVKITQEVSEKIKNVTLDLEIKKLNQEKQELLKKQKVDEEKGSNNESSFINKIKLGGSMLAGALALSTSLYYGSGYDKNAFAEVFLISGSLLGLAAHKVYAYCVPKK